MFGRCGNECHRGVWEGLGVEKSAKEMMCTSG